MTQYLLYICTAFLASAACGFVMIPQIMNYCKQKNLYDIPNSRKVHQNAVPRLGGISFLPSMLLAFFLVTLVMSPYTTSSEGTVTISLWSAYFLISLLLIYSVGIVDDLIGLNAKIKFIVQIVAAAIIPMSGLYINTLYGLWGIYEIPFELGAPLTVFIMVFIMNAINLIDGIDGLAASLSFLALGGFLMSFLREGMFVYCILIAGLMGVLLPYSYFNIFGKVERNRKIFMGDSGSLTLGFILSFLFVKFAMTRSRSRSPRVSAAGGARVRRGQGDPREALPPSAALRRRQEPHPPQTDAGGYVAAPDAAGHHYDGTDVYRAELLAVHLLRHHGHRGYRHPALHRHAPGDQLADQEVERGEY